MPTALATAVTGATAFALTLNAPVFRMLAETGEPEKPRAWRPTAPAWATPVAPDAFALAVTLNVPSLTKLSELAVWITPNACAAATATFAPVPAVVPATAFAEASTLNVPVLEKTALVAL